jgi:hypothetical protein
MYECIKKYPSKDVLGFDWLGTELEEKAIPESNKGTRMIFLMGADHRDYVIKKVSNELGNQILLNHLNKSDNFKIERNE